MQANTFKIIEESLDLCQEFPHDHFTLSRTIWPPSLYQRGILNIWFQLNSALKMARNAFRPALAFRQVP